MRQLVQTNGLMSRFRMSGTGAAYVDDLTVRGALPYAYGLGLGSVFKFR